MIYAKIQKQSNQSEYSFNHPVFLDGATGEMIFADNTTVVDEPATTTESAGNGTTESTTATGTTESADEGPIAEFKSTCADLNITNETAVRGLLRDMIAEGSNDLTDAIVDEYGREQLVDDVMN